MRVDSAMTSPAVTVAPTTAVKQAAALMAARGFTLLPVVDDAGQLLGVLSEGDLLAERLPPDARFPDTPHRTTLGRTVGEVMTTDAVTATRWDDARGLVRRMRARGIRAVPVCDQREVVGIVTYRDLVWVMATSDERISASVRRRLGWCFRPGRFEASVRDGDVLLHDRMARPDEWPTARVLAEQVPGVTGARVVAAHAEPDPDAVTAPDRR